MTATERALAHEGLPALLERTSGLDLPRLPPTVGAESVAAFARAPGDLEALWATATVRETYFLRHRQQLEAAARELGRSRRPGRPLRVWSAGCASGEEAYSLAAVLGPDAEVWGTDLVARAIERARVGRYRTWSLRGVDLEQEAHWLGVEGTEVLVSPDVRARVTFEVANVLDPPARRGFDLVFCRNVLLYLSERAVCSALANLAEATRVGGLLFVGPTDPQPVPEHGWRAEDDGVLTWYRRQAPGEAAVACPRPASAPLPGPALDPLPERSPRPQPPAAARPSSAIERARALCGQYDATTALGVLDELILAAPLEAELHLLAALAAEEAGLHSRALEAARSIVFLRPELPCGHFLLALAFERCGEPQRARHHYGLSCMLLAAFADLEQPLPLIPGLNGRQLRRMIDARTQRA